jgi:hypothetical protein
MMLNPLTDATRGAVAQAIAVPCDAAACAAERGHPSPALALPPLSKGASTTPRAGGARN